MADCECKIKVKTKSGVTNSKKLQLGFRKFPNHSVEKVDQLSVTFKNELFSFENPLTKFKEPLPIFDVITTQSNVKNTSHGRFKMFPPVVLPTAFPKLPTYSLRICDTCFSQYPKCAASS